MIAPPKPQPRVVDAAPHDSEALIEEARRRARSRRRRNGSAAGLVLCVGTLLLAFHGWGIAGGRPAPPKPSPGIVVGPRSTLVENGPLTVIRQAKGRGGVYNVGPKGLGRLVSTCDGCLEVEYIAWSPDGSRIALGVTSYAAPSPRDGLHVVDVATGRDRQLTGGPGRAGAWVYPAWSPDGQWIAYENDRLGAISLAKADGSQRVTVNTDLRDYLRSPTWSPDGTRIAFAADGTAGGCGGPQPATVSRECAIYVARLDGSHVRLLATHAASPAWSPLGTVIAYEARCGIRLVTPTGADVTPRAGDGCPHIGVAGQPVFSPDGRKIAVNSPAKGAIRGVYVMNSDGSDLFRLTHETGRSDFGVGARAAWRPVAISR
jgi:dipeptidyl aminopeptidase/acylaminoacyl peptidase